LIFGVSGWFKATHAKEAIVASGQTGVTTYGLGFIRFIAIAELLGCLGLLLPGLVGRARMLTPLAAAGLGVIMVGAGVSHARLARAGTASARREWANVGTNVVLLAACTFLTIARLAGLG
jgi:hypothetical protein